MGDPQDAKKIQADRAARKVKDKEQAKRGQPDTGPGKGPDVETVPAVTQPHDQVKWKNRRS